ncbi:MAG: YhcB family protein [Duncaniella sp.]|nr:YhcB family protein [Duncaniella sp.]
MTIDELKRTWNNIDPGSAMPASSAEGIEQRVALHLVASTRDKLSTQFYRMAVLCVASPLLLIPLWTFSHPLVITATAFFLIMAILQLVLGLKTDRIDITRTSAARALDGTVRLESLRGTFRVIGMCLGLPVIVFLGWVLYEQHDTGLFIGFVAGVVIGAVIGIAKNARLAQQIRLMKEELANID